MDPSQTGQLTVVLIQTAAAWLMTGLIWTKQVLNYPLLALIDPGGVPRYEQAHNRRFIWLVGPAGVYDRFVGNQDHCEPGCSHTGGSSQPVGRWPGSTGSVMSRRPG